MFASYIKGYANPIADFNLSVKQGCVPLTVKFTDNSSGSNLTYLWRFGNGNQSTLKNPSAIYYQTGNFSVTLTVTDASGNKATKTFTPIKVFKNPSAKFSADTVGCIGDNLRFFDNSIKGDTDIVKWTWDYGDGNLGSGSTSRHPYTYSSKFSIGLTVVDGYGCKSLVTKTNYIRIKPSPKPSFKLDKTYSCLLPGNFKATNTTTGNNTYKWICSDGSTSTTAASFTTNIQSFGKYNLKLVATGGGCSDTAVFSPLVIEKLVARFGFDQNTICVGESVKLSDLSTPVSNEIKYLWDFGDGETDKTKSPNHTFTAPGKYRVKLQITNGVCTDSMSQVITVNPVPDVNVSIVDSIGCAPPFKAEFRITGDYTGGVWDFGDKTIPVYHAKGAKIQHTYYKKGNFRVKVNVSNSYGCATEVVIPEKIQIAQQWVKIIPETFYDCLPISKVFTHIKSMAQPVESITWEFSDSNRTYNGKSVNKHFEIPGNFTAIIKVKTYVGCVVTDTAEISVGNKYVPTFKLLQYDVCGLDTLKFINTTADSIKKKVKFSFDLVPSFDGDTNSYVKNDSVIVTRRGGKHKVILNATHFGCVTPSEIVDSVYAHGPYVGGDIKMISCKNDRIELKLSYSWGNRYRLTKDDTMDLPYDKGRIISKYQPNRFIFRGWNDTFGCKDTVVFPDRPIGAIYFASPKYSLDQECAPSKANLSVYSNMKSFKWIFPNGDSSKKANTSYIFNNAGTYKVLLVGTYDSTNCPDSNFVNITVKGVQLKSNVLSNGKCMPIKLNLIDSAVGNDDYYHVWNINGKIIEAENTITNYEVSSIPVGDSFIRISHTVQSPSGCTSTKDYELPFGGPKGSYKITRFAICDTPVFYFDAIIDSSQSKYPVSFNWTTSSGYSSNKQNFGNKFKTIGMNYVNLNITDKEGCTASYMDSFEVSPNMIQPQFKADPTGRFCPPLKCQFNDMSKTFNGSPIVSWEWDFGDGTGSNLQNPQKLYLLPGNYDVSLKVVSSNGCTATIKKPGYVIVNGPRGSYDFDRGNACLPHTVEFRGKTLDSATMEWDLGDGVVQNGNNFKHTYKLPGRYIPAMILSDTLGCKYTLPPIDTIEVFDYPKAIVDVNGLCFHEPINIKNSSVSNHDDPYLKKTWYYNGKVKEPENDSFYKPQSRGTQTITLIVENKGTCKDTFEKTIEIYAPETDFNITDKFTCLGMPLSLFNTSKSAIEIVEYRWILGDGTEKKGKDVSHQYDKSGMYTVMLIAKDVMNCVDTIVKPNIAVIGDTAAPMTVPIRRASVINDHRTELVYSKIPNFDFNSYIVYKYDNNRYYKFAEIKNPNDTVLLDNNVNTLKSSYCYKVQVKNLCLLQSNLASSDPHCTIETKADGQFEANNVTWSPYIGFDTIAKYEIWRADEKDNKVYYYLDSVKGNQLQYTDTQFTCYTRKYYKIKAIQQGGFKEYSNSDTATAKPYYINTTKPNLAWRVTVEEDDFARLEWKKNAWSRSGIKGFLVTKTLANGESFFNDMYHDSSVSILIDKMVKVHDNSYIYKIRAVDFCDDTTDWSNVSQTVLLESSYNKEAGKPALKWNAYQLWEQDVDHYDIERMQLDGSFAVIGTVKANVLEFIDYKAESSCVPHYVYRVRAVSKWHDDYDTLAWSLSNTSKVLPPSTLFVPNAFSPDRNDINEQFGAKGTYISRYSIQVYNRWGEMVFESTDCMATWDGTYKGERCPQEVYLYHIEALGADNKSYNLKGTFHLLR